MIPFLLIGLLALGYSMKEKRIQNRNKVNKVPDNMIPSGENILSSTNLIGVRDTERKLADKHFEQSLRPFEEYVVPAHFNQLHIDNKDVYVIDDESYLDINGKGITVYEGMTHNNMIPFFGSKVTQNTNMEYRLNDQLELFTGQGGDTYQLKQESNALFQPNTSTSETRGNTFGLERDLGRYEQSLSSTKSREHEKFAAEIQKKDPMGEMIRPKIKTVDELRYSINPKLSYRGQMLGLKGGVVRGTITDNNVTKYKKKDYVDNDNGQFNGVKTSSISQLRKRSEILTPSLRNLRAKEIDYKGAKTSSVSRQQNKDLNFDNLGITKTLLDTNHVGSHKKGENTISYNIDSIKLHQTLRDLTSDQNTYGNPISLEGGQSRDNVKSLNVMSLRDEELKHIGGVVSLEGGQSRDNVKSLNVMSERDNELNYIGSVVSLEGGQSRDNVKNLNVMSQRDDELNYIGGVISVENSQSRNNMKNLNIMSQRDEELNYVKTGGSNVSGLNQNYNTNTKLNERKETISEGRRPTQQGAKEFYNELPLEIRKKISAIMTRNDLPNRTVDNDYNTNVNITKYRISESEHPYSDLNIMENIIKQREQNELMIKWT